ncbi:putative tyrosine phosphatase [Proteus hauseri ATCC 700826]|uniref:Tyrosine phosphatase n=1 Tax=Proteus hauseri ATCC 700826 TaxID=1354271 RepID=A0AAJ3LSG5_PROHU|nr:protein-tyrosine phosphatase family protein [Proteus hauseri]OAT44983.1 putative tyrosine phosphatase [Proteus hauseri ATCC 700826]
MLLSPVNLRCVPITTSLGSSGEVKNSTWNNIISIKNNDKEIKPILLHKPPAGSPIYKLSNTTYSPPTDLSYKIRIVNNEPHLLQSQRINKENKSLLFRRQANNTDIQKFNFSHSNKEVTLNDTRDKFLVAVEKCTGTDKYNEKAKILFNNLNGLKYNSTDYQSVENSRYSNKLTYRTDTLIKSGNVSLLANDVSSYNSPNITIASQYPLNTKENLYHYFNMFFNEKINTVYVLASNDDIKNDIKKDKKDIKDMKNIKDDSGEIKDYVRKELPKMGVKYNEDSLKKEGFKYFRENLDLGDIKSSHIEKWSLSKANGACLDCKTYTKLVTKENSNEKRRINFVHIYDWADHTGIDATKLKNTIDIIADNLKTNPTKENIAVHCLAGLGRTGEFIALMEMMKAEQSGNKGGKSLESIISDLREKRSVRALYQPEQIAELLKYAINNDIPLLNDDIKIK